MSFNNSNFRQKSTAAFTENPYEITKVVLAPISDEMQTDNNLEPPFVRIRSPNSSFTYLDTFSIKDRLSSDGSNTGKWIIGTNNPLFIRRTKRFGITEFRMSNAITNINPRNNTISFNSSNTGATVHTVVIPEGFYTPATATTALIATLNSITGTTGLTFTAPTIYPGNDRFISLTSAGGNFRILESDFTKKGYVFWGFNPYTTTGLSAPLSNTFVMGSITGVYTQYYDIVSASLNQFTKNPSGGNDVPGGHIFRVFTGDTPLGADITFGVPEIAFINFSSNSTLNNIDISVVDQFDDPVYIPSPIANNFYLSFAFIAEL